MYLFLFFLFLVFLLRALLTGIRENKLVGGSWKRPVVFLVLCSISSFGLIIIPGIFLAAGDLPLNSIEWVKDISYALYGTLFFALLGISILSLLISMPLGAVATLCAVALPWIPTTAFKEVWEFACLKLGKVRGMRKRTLRENIKLVIRFAMQKEK